MLQRNKLVSIGGVEKKKEKKASIDFTKSQLRIGEDKENYWNRSNSSPLDESTCFYRFTLIPSIIISIIHFFVPLLLRIPRYAIEDSS